VELIEGEILQMAPIDPEHVTATHSLYDCLRRVFGKGYVVRMQSPLSLGDSEPQPDLAVVAGSPSDFQHAHPTHAVLVIEVAQSSLPYDPARSSPASTPAQASPTTGCWTSRTAA
jgi:Uma2 family endonuclease